MFIATIPIARSISREKAMLVFHGTTPSASLLPIYRSPGLHFSLSNFADFRFLAIHKCLLFFVSSSRDRLDDISPARCPHIHCRSMIADSLYYPCFIISSGNSYAAHPPYANRCRRIDFFDIFYFHFSSALRSFFCKSFAHLDDLYPAAIMFQLMMPFALRRSRISSALAKFFAFLAS